MASQQTVDFSGVKDRGNFNTKQVPEGDYAARIVKVEDGESSKDNTFQYIFTIKLQKFSQNAYPYYCKLTDNQLWKLRNLLVAAGMNIPKRRMKLDPNKIVGRDIGVTMADDEYDGKMKSVIDAVFPISELAEGGVDAPVDDEDVDEEYDGDEIDVDGEAEPEVEAKPAKAKAKAKAEDKAEKPAKKKKKKKKSEEDEEDMEEMDITNI